MPCSISIASRERRAQPIAVPSMCARRGDAGVRELDRLARIGDRRLHAAQLPGGLKQVDDAEIGQRGDRLAGDLGDAGGRVELDPSNALASVRNDSFSCDHLSAEMSMMTVLQAVARPSSPRWGALVTCEVIRARPRTLNEISASTRMRSVQAALDVRPQVRPLLGETNAVRSVPTSLPRSRPNMLAAVRFAERTRPPASSDR